MKTCTCIAYFYSPVYTTRHARWKVLARRSSLFRAISFTFYNWAQRGSMNEGARIIIGIITASGAVKRIYRVHCRGSCNSALLRHRRAARDRMRPHETCHVVLFSASADSHRLFSLSLSLSRSLSLSLSHTLTHTIENRKYTCTHTPHTTPHTTPHDTHTHTHTHTK